MGKLKDVEMNPLPPKKSRNLRSAFPNIFVVISSFNLVIVCVSHILYWIEAKNTVLAPDESNFFLIFVKLLEPEWQSLQTILVTVSLYIVSLLANKTCLWDKETFDEQHTQRQLEAVLEEHLPAELFQQRVQNVISLIQDFKFKRYLIVSLEIIMLALIASFGSQVLLIIIPYTLYFSLLMVTQGLWGSQKLVSKVSSWFTVPIMAALLIDLPTKYLLQQKTFQIAAKNSYLQQVLGLHFNPQDFICVMDFSLKIALYIVQCQKLQYSFTFQGYLSQIRTIIRGHIELKDDDIMEFKDKMFGKKQSFTSKMLKPISCFSFSAIGMAYSLANPSYIMFSALPFLLIGLFVSKSSMSGLERFNRTFSKFFLCTLTFLIMFNELIAFYLRLRLSEKSHMSSSSIQSLSRVVSYISGSQFFDSKLLSKNPQDARYSLDFAVLLAISFSGFFISKGARDAEYIEFDNESLTSSPKKERMSLGIIKAPNSPVRPLIFNIDLQREKEKPRTKRDSAESDMKSVSADENRQMETEIGVNKQLFTARQPATQRISMTLMNESSVNAIKKGDEDDKSQSEEEQSEMIKEKPTKTANDAAENLRENLRKASYKIYKKLNQFFEQFLLLAIIHSSKVSLCALFLVSSTCGPTIFNAILFIMFLALSTISYQNVQKYWKLLILINCIIIQAIFAVQVFNNDISLTTLELIGIVPSRQKYLFSGLYTPYVSLLVILVFTYHILISEQYQTFLKKYQQLEDLSQRNTVSELSDEKSDAITLFIIRYSFYMTVAALFLECILMPINFLNLVLLTLMSVMLIKYFQNINSSLISLYQRLETTITLIKWVSTIFIFIKYMFQFDDFIHRSDEMKVFMAKLQSNSSFGNQLEEYFDKLPLVERLLGMENTFVPIKLFSLALVMSLTNLQQKFLKYSYLTDMLKFEDKQVNNTMRPLSNQNKLLQVFYKVKTIVIFMASFLIKPAPALILVYYTATNSSFLSFSMLIVLLAQIVLQQRLEGCWARTYVTVGILATIALLILYFTQFLLFTVFPKTNSWHTFVCWSLGLYEPGARQQKEIWNRQILPLFQIIVVCGLQKALEKWTEYKLHVPSKEMLLNASSNSANTLKQLNEFYEREGLVRRLLGIKQNTIIKTHRVIKNALFIAMIAVGLMVVMIKCNMASFLYFVMLIQVINQGYYAVQKLKDTPQVGNMEVKKEKVVKILKINLVAIIFVMMFESLMMIEYIDIPLIQDLNKWKEKIILNYFCEKHEPECRNEWIKWLTIGYIQQSYLLYDLLYLHLVLLTKQALQQTSQNMVEDLEEIDLKLHDKDDFMSEGQNKLSIRYPYRAMVLTFLFSGFPYLLIFLLFIYSMSNDGDDIAELISVVYLCFGLTFILHFRSLYTKNTTYLKPLRVFNFVIAALTLLFQMPVFICPFSQNDDQYVTNKKCVEISTKDYSKMNSTTYSMIMKSIGIKKIDQDAQLGLIILVVMTEIQTYLFHHPYFQFYVLQHLKKDLKTNAKLRAFIFVEHSHLQILWAFKAIKEEIGILHQRLLRITQAIKDSQHSRHLLLDIDEDLIEDEENESIEGQEERKTLINDNEAKKISETELESSNGADTTSKIAITESIMSTLPILEQTETQMADDFAIFGSNLQQIQEREVQRMLNLYANEIESRASEMLNSPSTPVVPLKIFMAAFKNYLQRKLNKQFKNQVIRPSIAIDTSLVNQMNLFDNDEISIYLDTLATKLQKQINLKNRINLFNKQGLGLNLALDRGSDKILISKGNYKFYHHLIQGEQELSLIFEDEKDVESESSVNEDNEEIRQLETQDKLKSIIDKPLLPILLEEDTIVPQTSFFRKMDGSMREYLWGKFMNQHLIVSLNIKEPQTIYNVPFIKILANCVMSQSQNIFYMTLFLNFIINGDLLSLVLPLSVLFYALIERPQPSIVYFKCLQVYLLCVIVAKFLYQLPLFCASPPFTIYDPEQCSSEQQHIPLDVLMKRQDYLIGLRKYWGSAAYPQDGGIVRGLLPDIVCVAALLIMKRYLVAIGLWDYVRVHRNIYQTPCFKRDKEDLKENEIILKKVEKEAKKKAWQQATLTGKCKITALSAYMRVKSFFERLLPMYMSNRQNNLDMRTQEEQPFIHHNLKRVKPGKDYFAASFFSLLVILTLNLFFYRNITGIANLHSASEALNGLNLQKFSIPQVTTLFVVLLLMMIERMLYRARGHHTQHSTYSAAQSSHNSDNITLVGKHQLAIKLVIHVALVIFVHFELCMILPREQLSLLAPSKRLPLILYYLIWLYYFILGALQLRDGYPQAPFKAPFIRDTRFLTVWAFRIYKAMPFLWEMKVIIDWTVTITCLDLFQWFKVDDAFNYLYQCQVSNDDRKSRKEYAQRPWYEKFFQGFCFAFSLILVILAPVLLFSGINPIMVNNPVVSGHMSLSLELNQNGNTYNLLQTQAYRIQNLETKDYKDISKIFSETLNGEQSVNGFHYEQQNMQKMYFSPYSELSWSISPPSMQKFIEDYQQLKADNSDAFFEVKTQWVFERDNPIGNEETRSEMRTRLPLNQLEPIINTLHSHSNQNQTVVASNSSTILVTNIFPKLLKLGSTQQTHLLEVVPLQSNFSMVGSAKLSLKMGGKGNESNGYEYQQMYWTYEILEIDQRGVFKDSSSKNSNSSSTINRIPSMVLVVYNEQVIGAFFGTALQLSVVGLYATIVVAIGRFLRLIFDRISQRVIYEEMDPETTEQLLEICEGIYIAQLEGDLVKEKRFYDLLIRMYRSPETLIKINRRVHKQQILEEQLSRQQYITPGPNISQLNASKMSRNVRLNKSVISGTKTAENVRSRKPYNDIF